MEQKFKIYTIKTVTKPDGLTQEITNEIGSFTREELVKAMETAIKQRDRMQELVDISSRKINLVDEAIAKNLDYIIL